MATNRFGYSDDFVLKNGKVGINTADPQATLDVQGTIKATSLKTTSGLSTFTTYEGFLNSNHNIDESLTVNSGASLSGEIIVGTGVTATVGSAATGSQGAIDSLKVYNTFNPPVGGTNDRPIKAKPGQLYYNQDFKTIEFWDGYNWRQVDYTAQSGRGVIGGGYNGSAMNNIEYLNISSLGNGQDFGTLNTARFQHGSCSSSIRGLWCGGATPGATNEIEYITIASSGNGLDFGDSTLSLVQRHGGLSSSTRGIFNSGLQTTPSTLTINVIEYVEISTLGNALDFGDLSKARFDLAAFSSSTRGIFAGGFNENDSESQSVIDFITIASKGDAVEFGDLSVSRRGVAGASNSTRAIMAGGVTPSVRLDTIDYLTIASSGNAIDFGKLSSTKAAFKGASSNTRVIFVGGATPGATNEIEFITIASLGDAQDFGDLSAAGQQRASLSDSHGGLGGF